MNKWKFTGESSNANGYLFEISKVINGEQKQGTNVVFLHKEDLPVSTDESLGKIVRLLLEKNAL